jgi:hypothetical protein
MCSKVGLICIAWSVCTISFVTSQIGLESKVGEGLLVWKTLFDPSKA